ncbi:hypothetical protein HYS00_03525 [Candidatus Microgenomates bacterium]|nr:hypothetical protein [Candidatus Microgenomates bacterium]
MKSTPSFKYGIVLVSIVVLLLSFLFVGVSAQNPSSAQSLVVSPASQEIKADPGSVVRVKASLRNQSSTTLPITARIEDFTASGDEGQVALTAESPYSVANWTTITPRVFRLKPGESQEITATISVPRSAAGGRYGSFVFAVTPEGIGPNDAKVSQEIASLFLVRISGPVDEHLSLNEFSAPQFSEAGPIGFSMKFKNSGNVHIKTLGLINVTGLFNKKIADIVVKPENIFPGAERMVSAQLDKHFLIGPYTATAIMYYGSNNETLNSTVSFFVFPVRAAGIVLLVLILFYLIRKRLRKAMKALFS